MRHAGVGFFAAIGFVLHGSLAWGACPLEATSGALDETLRAAEVAFASLDAESFGRRMDDAAFALPCVREISTPQLAARYHRLTGLRVYGLGEEEQAAAAFAAARAAEPDYVLPDLLVPAGHSLRDVWVRVPIDRVERVPVPEPIEGWLFFDGQRARSRPGARPTWLQLVGTEGEVLESIYLLPNDAMPDYAAKPFRTGAARRRPARIGLGVTAAAAAVTAGTLYAVAAASERSFQDDHPDYTPSDLVRHQERTNRLVLASAGTGAAALIAGIGFLAVF